MTLHGIDDLLGALRELGGVMQPVRVAEALRGVRIDERTLAPYLTWAPGRYTRNLVARDAAYDHADSDCAFVLQHGAITCENFRIAWPDAPAGRCELKRTTTRTLREGEIDMRSGHLSVHRVGAEGGRAITLHVYAKPIDTCLNFDEDGTTRSVNARYDTVPGSVS